MIKLNLKEIKAQEPDTIKKKKNFFSQLQDRYKHPLKRMEILAGEYNTKYHIILSQNALIKSISYSAINMSKHGSKEIMGYLAGKHYDDKIEIVDAYIGNCKSSGAYTEIDCMEKIRLIKLAHKRGLVIVGQWHLHPNMGVHPSGTDDEFMINLERMGMKSPVQLITNLQEFSLTIMENERRKKAEFIIPPKTDNKLDLEFGTINDDYVAPLFNNTYYQNDVYDEPNIIPFCGWLGNWIFRIIGIIPFVNLKKYISE